MAEKANTDAPVTESRRDHVAMLSLKKDGTPADHDPVFIDEEFALEATKRQLRENAVSVVDEQERAKAEAEGVTGLQRSNKQDPFVEKLTKAHDSAAASAEKKAESLVKSIGTDK